MINYNDIEKVDINGMHKIYDKWPEIAKKSYDIDFEPIQFPEIDHIVFAGMGGSGALGDFFSSILSKTNIHTSIVKGYELPKTVNKNTLVVVISISGNTHETLSVLKQAHTIHANVVAFSSGGMIEKYCLENNLKFRKIEKYHSPRTSFVAYLYSILKILQPYLPIEKNEIYESIKELEKLSQKISSNNLSKDNPSLDLAYWINDIPIIYFPSGFQAASTRFKNSLQENTKMEAISEDVLEMCHNGIVSWDRKSKFKPIFLEGRDDHLKTKERWRILKDFFDSKKIEYKEIFSIEGNILSKLIHLIYLLDYASIYLAILNNIDPTPVKPIDFIKKRL
ncbi:SIS domain-containing protein [Nitrosopumilus sp. S6]